MSGVAGTSVDPHRRTLEVYDRAAAEWQARRHPEYGDVRQFNRELIRAAPDHRVADLGCGPGWHLPELPTGAVGLDGAAAMLGLAAVAAPAAPLVQADLRSLPFADRSLTAAWADRSYVHLARSAVPLAWWDLHRALRVGAPVYLRLFGGDQEHAHFAEDDVPGRSFSTWPLDLLRAVVEGAGFGVELVERRESDGFEQMVLWLRRRRTLADTVGPRMQLLLVGLNPSLVAADAGVGFHRPGNRAWPALLAAGLASSDRDPRRLLVDHRIGMTDLVKRATPRADELTGDEYRAGLARLELLCRWLRPAAVCVVGLTGWRAATGAAATAGPQARRLGGRPVYLMPNPSGANAHVQLDDLVAHLVAARELADASARELADTSARELAGRSGEGRG